MIAWFIGNSGTIFVSIVLLLLVFFIIRHMIKERKSGKGGCGSGSSGCANSGMCHGHNHS